MSADADRKHPFGDSRAERIERWRAIATFGEGDMAAIAKLVLEAAAAPTRVERNAAALFAMGLHKPTKTDDNRRALREALVELCRIVDAVYPPADDDDDPMPSDPAAMLADRAQLGAVLDCGVSGWLFERAFVSAGPDVDDDSKVRQLRRLTAAAPDLRRLLQWALDFEWRERPPKPSSRGRVR